MNKNLSEDRNNKKILTFIPTGGFYFQKGVKAFESGDLQTAKKYLKRACELEPDEGIFACQLAIVLAENEEYERSNEILFNIIRKINPYMYEVYYFLANNFAYLGMYHEAIHYATKYLQQVPYGEFADSARELLDILALENDELNDFYFSDPAEWQKENELIHHQDLAKQLLESGQLAEATEVLTELLDEFPEFWPAYNNLALAKFYEGDHEEAIRITREVLEKNPGNLHALCNLTVFHFQTGVDIQREVSALKKIYPISADHRYKLGVTFTIIGQYSDGFKWLKSLMDRANTLDSNYYYWLSYSAYFTGRIDLAEKSWRQLMLLHPEKEGEEPWNAHSTPLRP